MSGFIQAKAEAWAIHNWWRLNSWNWFAAGQKMRDDLGWPTKMEYRDQVVEWARHVYQDHGDPEADTADAVDLAIKNMTKVLRASSIKDKIKQSGRRDQSAETGGLNTHTFRDITTTSFTLNPKGAAGGTAWESRWLAVHDPDPMPKLLVDEVLATMDTHPAITDGQRRTYRSWLRHECNAEAAAKELGVSRQRVSQVTLAVNDMLRRAHPDLVVKG